jgi:outer membrane immunogenic protein
MKKQLIGMLGLMALASSPALAADLPTSAYQKAPAVTVYDWTGFYIGLNAGGGSERKCWTNSFAAGALTIPPFSEGCNDATGPLLGGQVGYRWQWTNWVFGIEATGDWANLTGSNASFLLVAPQETNQSKVNALGLFTGQVGYTWNKVLWFAKGGVAVTSSKYNGIDTASGTVLDRASDTRWGAAVGTGIEVAFGTNWSVSAEYDHLFMGTSSLNFLGVPAGGLSRRETIQQDADMALLRVNYRFGGPVVARY